MIDRLLQIIAPHHCCGCGETGSPLCANCKYDIINDGFSACVVCLAPTSRGICRGCQTSYERAWCVGDRRDVLARLIDAYKFERVRAAHRAIADLLDDVIETLPPQTIVVPIPTVPSHVRVRGYDHTALVATRFANHRGLRVRPLLVRQTNSVQRGASKRARMVQAEQAFLCADTLEADVPYLLIDDIITTNATVRFAAQTLRDAGASQVWVAVAARQPDPAQKK